MPDLAPSPPSDRDRFHAMFEEQFSYVWTALFRLGVFERDADDVVHELFMEVFRRFDTYDPARPVRPWLFAFAFRFASDYRRRARHRVELLVDHDAEGQLPSADELLERKDAQRLIQAALERVELDRRAVFILHDLEECSMQEIADSLKIPVNTAYSRLRTARQEFQRAVERISKEASR